MRCLGKWVREKC